LGTDDDDDDDDDDDLGMDTLFERIVFLNQRRIARVKAFGRYLAYLQ
jgi:hypothetical protein